MQSASDVATGLTLTLFASGTGLCDSHRHRLPVRTNEIPYGTSARDLARAFLAVDWLVRTVLPLAVEHHGGAANDLRSFPEIGDSLHALCARQLCNRMPGASAAVAAAASNAITELVWADAAIAARSGRPHPLAEQVERIARGCSFSDPLDFGYLDRAGTEVASGVIEALAIGVAIDLIAPSFEALWERISL